MKHPHQINTPELPNKKSPISNSWLDLYALDNYFFSCELPNENFVPFKRDNIDRKGWLSNHKEYQNKNEADVITQLDTLLGKGFGKKLILAYNSGIQSFIPFVLASALSRNAEITIKQPDFSIHFGKDENTNELLLHVATNNYTVYDLKINYQNPFDLVLGYLKPANLLFRLKQNYGRWGFQLEQIETEDEIILSALKGRIFSRKDLMQLLSLQTKEATSFPGLPGTVLDDYKMMSENVRTYYGLFSNPYRDLDFAYQEYFAARDIYEKNPSLQHGENVVDAFIDFHTNLNDLIKKFGEDKLSREVTELSKKSATEKDALTLTFKLHLDAFTQKQMKPSYA